MLLVQDHSIEFIEGKHHLWYEKRNTVVYAEGFDGYPDRISPILCQNRDQQTIYSFH